MMVILKNRISKFSYRSKLNRKILFSMVVLIELAIIFNLIKYSPNVNDLVWEYAIDEVYKHEDYMAGNAPLSLNCIEYYDEVQEPSFGLKPNCSIIYNGVRILLNATLIEINSAGYRGELYPKEKPEGVYRVVVLGDSLTFGLGVNLTDTFPYILEQMLNEDSDVEYQVINLGAPRYDLEDNVNLLNNKGLDYEPDLVIFSYYSNDIENKTRIYEIYESAKENQLAPDNLGEREKELFYSSYSIYFYSEEIKNNDEYRSEIETRINKTLNILENLSLENNFSVLLLFWDSPEERKLLIEYAEENGWSFVTTDDIYEAYPLELLHLHPLDIHPTSLFHEKVADEIYRKGVGEI